MLYQIQDMLGHVGFGHLGQVESFAILTEDGDDVGVAPKSSALVTEGVEDNHVQVFFFQLLQRVGFFVVGFEGKADEGLILALHTTERGGDVGIFYQLIVDSG